MSTYHTMFTLCLFLLMFQGFHVTSAAAIHNTTNLRGTGLMKANNETTMMIYDKDPFALIRITNDDVMIPSNTTSTMTSETRILQSLSRTILVVRVSASGIGSPSVSKDELYFRIFSDGNSVKHHMARCSAGALQFNPTNYGVMDVYVDANWGTNQDEIVMKAEAQVLAIIGNGYTNVRQIANHVMFVLPNLNDGYVASAEVCPDLISGTSQYGDTNGSMLSVVMHELGHNLGMNHASTSNDDYGDRTSNMGMSSSQVGSPLYCYNAANHWTLGWFPDSRLDLSTVPSTPITVTVPAFVDYQEISGASGQYVLVRVGNYFLQYNRAKDHNIGTKDLIDQLVIVFDGNPGSRGKTNLITGLHMQNPYYSDGSVSIQVCSVQTSGNVDFMVISIGQGHTDCQAGGVSTSNSVPQQQQQQQQSSSSVKTTNSGWSSWSTKSNGMFGN